MAKLRNVVIINDFDYTQGGASKVAIDTANLLCNKYNVYFFSGDSKNGKELDSKVKRICTFQGEALKDKNKLRGAINGVYNFKAKSALKTLLKSLDSSETIIHVHGWTKCLSSSVFDIVWKMHFKIILTMHDYFTACPNGGYFNYRTNSICHLNPLSLKCLKCNCDSRNRLFKLYRIIRQFVQNKIVKLNDRLEYVISISNFSEKILRDTLSDNVNITKIYNPIDFTENTLENDLSKKDYYLYVGRVSKEKGVDIFCQALSELKLTGIVVGDGNQKDILKEQYPNIEFVGWKNSEEVKKYMRSAKALIMPSRWYEGAPLTNLEALSVGLPSLVSNCCAASDVSNEINKVGDTFECSVEGLKKCIMQYKIRPINHKNAEKILKNYAPENYVDKIIKLYMNVVGEKNEKNNRKK